MRKVTSQHLSRTKCPKTQPQTTKCASLPSSLPLANEFGVTVGEKFSNRFLFIPEDIGSWDKPETVPRTDLVPDMVTCWDKSSMDMVDPARRRGPGQENVMATSP